MDWTLVGELAELHVLERTTFTIRTDLLNEEGWTAETESDDARKRCLKLIPNDRKTVEEPNS